MTSIEWTHGPGRKGETWNPIAAFNTETGKRGWFCTKPSAGCKNCYAERWNKYIGNGLAYTVGNLDKVSMQLVNLDEPLHWRKPRMVFVGSMTDLFHEAHTVEMWDSIFAVMAVAERHVFQVLTKRPARMRAYLNDPQTPFRIQRAIDGITVDRTQPSTEQWRPVVGYEGLYEVSTNGRVKRLGGTPKTTDDRILTETPGPRGRHLQVALCRDAGSCTTPIHQIVLRAFVGEPQPGEEACHRNGDDTDNRVANLRWGTRAENMKDAVRHGTAGAWMRGRATLTRSQVREIRVRRARGEKLEEIAAAVGSNARQVSEVALEHTYAPAELPWPLPNVWIGTTTENQQTADERIPELLATPAAVRWLSVEPMIEAVNLNPYLWRAMDIAGIPGWALNDGCTEGVAQRKQLHWVVVGGESGSVARECCLTWIEKIVADCAAASVPCFVKQLGRHPFDDRVGGIDRSMELKSAKGGDMDEWPVSLRVREYPEVAFTTAVRA